MDNGVWADARSLLWTLPMAGAVPRIVAGASRKAAEFIRTFEDTVRPILDETVTDPRQRAQVAESLVSYATKTCFVVAGYARMTGVPFAREIGVLGVSFARLYDDLFDEIGSGDLGQRLEGVFAHGVFEPSTDLELLLSRFYQEIDRRLGRDRDDPVYAAARALHQYQMQSRRQHDPRTSLAALAEITRKKGGQGTLAVFALMRAGMRSRERELVLELGEILQLLDDYLDAPVDRRLHMRTLATEGKLPLSEVCRRFRLIRPELIAYYGRHNTEEFLGVCYLTLWMCFLRRNWPHIGTHGKRKPGRSPMDILVLPGDNVTERGESGPREVREPPSYPGQPFLTAVISSPPVVSPDSSQKKAPPRP